MAVVRRRSYRKCGVVDVVGRGKLLASRGGCGSSMYVFKVTLRASACL